MTDGQSQAAGSRDAELPDAVELVIPASSRFLRLARMTAAGLASDLDFGLHEVEDVRVAVDELCAAMVEHGQSIPGSRLSLSFLPEPGVLRVEGRLVVEPAEANGQDSFSLHPVAREVLRLVCDDFELATVDGTLRCRMEKSGGLIQS